VKATDLQGAQIELTLEGFTATVFQHEFDHLDGRLYVDLIKDPRKLVFEEELARYGEPG
jgi:peptide deformylase